VTRSYTVELRTEPLEHEHSPALFDRAAKTLFADRTIAGPVMTLDGALRIVDVRTSVDAANSIQAVIVVANAVGRALRAAHIPANPGRIEVWPDLEAIDFPDELVNGGEVARRLRISRERLRQLLSARPPRLPLPVAETERDRIWRWGDVAQWAQLNERRTKVPRRRRTETNAIDLMAALRNSIDRAQARETDRTTPRPRKRTA
jgi:hypothetical protein